MCRFVGELIPLWLVLVTLVPGSARAADPGDVNGDGKVTVADAVTTLVAAVHLISLTAEQTEAADVDPYPGRGGRERGDGRITIGDAVRILRASVGLLPDLSYSPTLHIEGVYQWVRDSDGAGPKAGAIVGLDFGGHGVVSLGATQPGEQWTSDGSYAVAGDRIDLSLPEMGWTIQDRPFVLKDGTLTLPLRVMGATSGTSTWERMVESALPGQRALGLLADSVRQGLSGEEAQDRIVSALQAEYGAGSASANGVGESRPVEEGPHPLQATDVTQMRVGKDCRNLFLRYDDGHPTETVLLRSFPSAKRLYQTFPLTFNPIGGDPRSQVPYHPTFIEDNPRKLTAWLLSPTLNGYTYHYEGPIFKADGSTKTVDVRGHSSCLKDDGFDPDYLKKVFEWAGYTVRTASDAQVTLRQVVDALRDEPGVLVISAHGTLTDRGLQPTLAGPLRQTPSFMTGVVLYDYWQSYDKKKEKDIPFFRDAMRERLDAQVETVKELFPDLPPPGNPRRYAILDHYLMPVWMAFTEHTGQVWLSYTADFLALVRQHYSLDFSRSLVIASACDSATTAEGALALRPKAYFGYLYTEYVQSAPLIEKYLVAAMARETFNAREVYTRAFIVPGQKTKFYIEDTYLGWWLLAGSNGIIHLKAYGNELTLPTSDNPDSGLTLAAYQPYSSTVFWLTFMNRWSTRLDDGRAALEGCYETYWKAKRSPGLADHFCEQGILGNHYPTEDEVADATLAVTGKSSYRDHAFNGRFTLNDGPSRPSYNPPPWDKK